MTVNGTYVWIAVLILTFFTPLGPFILLGTAAYGMYCLYRKYRLGGVVIFVNEVKELLDSKEPRS